MKEIEINNYSELNKKLFLYKSIFYRKVKFVSNSDDENVRSIITALNIKKRYKRLEYIYDYCCNTIDKFYAGKNICGFLNGKCMLQQTPGCNLYDGCCRLCIHQEGKGCKTANLSCKFFFCNQVKSKNEIIRYRDLKILKMLSLRQSLMVKDNFFSTREEILMDLYYGSIILFGVRMSLRVIRDFGIFGYKSAKRKRTEGD